MPEMKQAIDSLKGREAEIEKRKKAKAKDSPLRDRLVLGEDMEKEIEKRKKDPGKERRDKISAAADKGMEKDKEEKEAARTAIRRKPSDRRDRATATKPKTAPQVKLPPAKTTPRRPTLEEAKKKKPAAGTRREPLTGLGEELPAGRRKEK